VALVSAAVTLSGYTTATFGRALRAAFVTATAATLNIDAADIEITGISDAAARRKLASTGVTVAFTVAAPTTASVTALSMSIIRALSTSSAAAAFTAQLQSAGMTAVTAVELVTPPQQVAVPVASGVARVAACTAALVASAAAVSAVLLA
jgi:hypothetical protein